MSDIRDALHGRHHELAATQEAHRAYDSSTLAASARRRRRVRGGVASAGAVTTMAVLGLGMWLALGPADPTAAVDSPPAAASSPEPVDAAAGSPVTIVFIGADNRVAEGGETLTGESADMRADTTVVMHISADRGRIEMISLPRDSRVQVPDCTLRDGSVVEGSTGRLGVAFTRGGIEGDVDDAATCLQDTVRDALGLEIDHYAVIEFADFSGLVDALGGVPLCVPEDVHAPEAGLDLTAGYQVLDGETALAWARVRSSEDPDDSMRIARQQDLFASMVATAVDPDLLADPSRSTAVAEAVSASLATDALLGDPAYVRGLAWSLKDLDPAHLYQTTIPWEDASDGSGDVVWKDAEARAMFDAIAADESIIPAGYARASLEGC